MAKKALLILVLTASFVFGFAFNSIFTNTTKSRTDMKRVTGIGGVFFKSKDPENLKQWYKTHLGFELDPYGIKFEWQESSDPTKKGYTIWSPFSENTKYFDPSEKQFMINYRVENLEALVDVLKEEGVTILDEIESYDYGKFVHILDNEGNKIELWEPI